MKYSVIPIGLDGDVSSYPIAINNLGHVLGKSRVRPLPDLKEFRKIDWGELFSKSAQSGFFWTPEGAIDLGSAFSPKELNDRDVVVGDIGTSPVDIPDISVKVKAVQWESGGVREVSIPGGTVVVTDINKSGELVGHAISTRKAVSALRWLGSHKGPVSFQDGEWFPLEVPWGYAAALTVAINNKGVCTGYLTKEDFTWEKFLTGKFDIQQMNPVPVLWRNRAVEFLPLPPGCVAAMPQAINKRGEIIGRAWSGGVIGCTRKEQSTTRVVAVTCLWQDGEVIDLLDKSKAMVSGIDLDLHVFPQSINSSGSIVGEARSANRQSVAFLWQDWSAYNLQDLVDDQKYKLRSAVGVNDLGQIACKSMCNGVSRAVLLQPI